MREALALVAYGLLLLTGFFMTFFWGRLAGRKLHEVRWGWLRDRYAVIATSLTLSSIGTVVFFGTRAYQFLHEGLSTVSDGRIPSSLVLFGLLLLVVSKTGFVWALQMEWRAYVWRMFVILSLLWVIGASIWVVGDPF